MTIDVETRPGFDREDGSCKWCDGHAVPRHVRGKNFLGCSNYPACRNTEVPRARQGSFLCSQEDIDHAHYDAFYEGDG